VGTEKSFSQQAAWRPGNKRHIKSRPCEHKEH
jgi:hypothetical protein